MEKSTEKIWYKCMWIYITGGILLVFAIYLIVQGIRCNIAVKSSVENLAAYGAKTAHLSYGDTALYIWNDFVSKPLFLLSSKVMTTEL